MSHPYAVRLGLPSSAGSVGDTLTSVGGRVVAGKGGSGAASHTSADNDAPNELAAPLYRMRFGRDLRLAEVRICGGHGARPKSSRNPPRVRTIARSVHSLRLGIQAKFKLAWPTQLHFLRCAGPQAAVLLSARAH